MMYQNKIATAIKVGGKVLREFDGDTVKMPYGSEYSVLVKNLNSVRAQIRLSIDGTDTSDGVWFVIPANSEIELKRFVKDGNLDKGNSFKFIERTESIENHRGTKLDDGLIRIEVQFEKPYNCNWNGVLWNNNWDWHRGSPSPTFSVGGGHYYNNSATYGVAQGAVGSLSTNSVASASASAPVAQGISRSISVSHKVEAQKADAVNDMGITVPGSENNQKFTQASWFQVENETHVLIMKMVGYFDDKKVVEPITVKHKPKCNTCGKLNKANAKFCSECGTAITLF